MNKRTRLTTAFIFFATLLGTLTSNSVWAQSNDLKALDGDWLYVEDRTEGRAVERQGPPMSTKFPLRVEKDAVIMVRPRGDERIALDGSVREVNANGAIKRYRGEWKDGVLKYNIETERLSDNKIVSVIRREFRITPDGLQVKVFLGPPERIHGVALYRHPVDIELPKPAKAKIADMNWLTGAWVGTRGKSSIEERWSPPLGGAILGTSRTVRGEKMVGFEFLRIVERDGGLVYVAQPGGRSPTEFVLTKLETKRAEFVNPRHDYPQRIVYELPSEGQLTTTIGFAKGGSGRSFEYKRENK